MSEPRGENQVAQNQVAGASGRAGLPAWLVVARRELLERVRTKWFLIVTVLGPLALAGILVLPVWLSTRSAEQQVRIQIADHTGRDLGQAIARLLPRNYQVEVVPPETSREAFVERIRRAEIDGFLWLPADTLEAGKATYEGANTTNMRLMLELQQTVYVAALGMHAVDAGISMEQVARIMGSGGVELSWKQNTGTGEQASSGQATLLVGYAVMFTLYIAILLYAVNVLRGVVQEKTSRVVEIIVSAIEPRALMLGKILGVGAVGLLQLGIWAAVALLLVTYRGELLGALGMEGGNFDVPPLGVIDVAVILAYFFLGYFFYASLYAAIGAMVNSDQEAQQAQMPVTFLIVIPVLCMQLVADDPRGQAAAVLTQIPFASPVLMPMRYLLGGASPGAVLLSLGILCAAIAVAVVLAARIYRVGILMYGKRPTLRELARWLRHG